MTKSPPFLTSFVLIFPLIHSSLCITDLTFLPWFTWIHLICHLKKESWSQSPYRLLSWNFIFFRHDTITMHHFHHWFVMIWRDLLSYLDLAMQSARLDGELGRLSQLSQPASPDDWWQVSLWNSQRAHHLRPFCTSWRLAPGFSAKWRMWRWHLILTCRRLATFYRQMWLRWLWRRSKDTKWMTVARLKNFSCCRSSR